MIIIHNYYLLYQKSISGRELEKAKHHHKKQRRVCNFSLAGSSSWYRDNLQIDAIATDFWLHLSLLFSNKNYCLSTMQATWLWIPYLQASSWADWSLWSLQRGLTSLLSLIFFKESCPSGGSGSKINCRSLRNTEALKFCSFIDSIVFCSLFPHTSATCSVRSPLTHAQADLAFKD